MADTTIDIDSETARLVERLARRRQTTASVIVKDAVTSHAAAAGLATPLKAPALEAPAQWVDSMIALLDTLPQRGDDDRSIDGIIGYDEHGLP